MSLIKLSIGKSLRVRRGRERHDVVWVPVRLTSTCAERVQTFT